MAEIPLRETPQQPWGRVALAMAILVLVGVGGWEAFWRSQQFRPSYRGSDGLWAIQRRAVDRAEGPTAVAIGSSRTLSDLDLETWGEVTGTRPIQLALEGTNPRPVLRDLARRADFEGLVVVGVTPALFTAPDTGYRRASIRRYVEESPSQWIGQQVSMLLEPIFAFYNFDTALFTVIERQTWWPARANRTPGIRAVRKIFNYRKTREADLWTKLDDDPAYAALAQDIWRDFLYLERELPPEDVLRAQFEAVLDEVRADVDSIRSHGGEVVLVRFPSDGEFRQVEAEAFPRDRVWNPIVMRSGAVAIHFEDYPQLQGMRLPEWSHMSSRDTDRFTRSLIEVIRDAFAERGIVREELTP